MFQTWSYNDGLGLGQTKSCQEIVQEQLARGYVFAGTALAWSGKGNVKDTYLDSFIGINKLKLENAISASLASNNFYGIRIDTSTPIVSTGPGTKIGIWVTAPIDFSSLNDVRALISGIVADHVDQVQDVTISVREIPPMCAGSPVAPSPGTQAPPTLAPGTPREGSGGASGGSGILDLLGLNSTGNVVQWLVIGLVGVVAVKALTK